MPRRPRIVIQGVAHLLTQRGNNSQDVFLADKDKIAYLEKLVKKAEKYSLEILGYCLMSNNVHLIGTPRKPESLAKAFGRTNLSYTQYFNEKYSFSGHLWQNRYYSCPLDEEHFWRALCYIERIPVRAGLVENAWSYSWSSAAAHIGNDSLDKLIDLRKWESMAAGIGWESQLKRPDDKKTISRINRSLKSGRPLGNDDFIDALELKTSRRLRPLPVGRPPKK